MIFVTSDLHGYSPTKFQSLLDKAGFSDDDFCYILGDVIDRGESGAGLLRYVMTDPHFELLLGNHEQMLLSCHFLFDDITEESAESVSSFHMRVLSNWLSNGGQTTIDGLRKFSRETRLDILDYLHDAPKYQAITVNGNDFIFTHSGLGNFSPDKKLSEYTDDELLWTRPDLNTVYFDNITTIFGHTPTLSYGNAYKGRAIITDTWINIDTGVAAGLAPMLLCLDTNEFTYGSAL